MNAKLQINFNYMPPFLVKNKPISLSTRYSLHIAIIGIDCPVNLHHFLMTKVDCSSFFQRQLIKRDLKLNFALNLNGLRTLGVRVIHNIM